MRQFLRLLKHLYPYRRYLAVNVVCNILMAVFTVISIPLFVPFFRILFGLQPPATARPDTISGISDMIDWVNYSYSLMLQEKGPSTTLLYTCGAILLLFFFKNFFRYLAAFFVAPVRNGIVYDIRAQVYYKLLDLPVGFFTESRKGDLLTRITSDVQEIESSILNMIEGVFRSPVTIIGSLVIMLYMSPGLTVIVFVLMFFTGGIIGGISSRLRRQSRTLQDILGRLVSTVEETLTGMRVIKGLKGEEFQRQHFNAVNERYRDLQTKIIRRRDLSSPLSEFLGITVVAVLLWIGAQRIFAGELGAESFLAFLLAFYNVIEPSKQLTNAWYNIQKGLAAVDRVDVILQAEDPVRDSADAAHVDAIREGVAFEDVWFRYPGTEKWALQGVTFQIPRGQTVALIGLSGAGKSTIADLIPRFYDVTKGRITIDGKDIRDIRIADLRGLLGMVTQEPILFHETVANNILFGKEANEAAVRQAAQKAHATTFIDQLDDGIHSNIGDRGGKLSGGQRQRLTIARAILRDPQLLILDEATSALDSESERLVQDALNTLLTNRTALVIAHRLSTIRRASTIIVLRDGRIIESGDHDTLLSIGGEYSRLVDLQGLHD